MLNQDLIERLTAAAHESRCFDELHPKFVELFKNSQTLRDLTATMCSEIMTAALKGDKLGANSVALFTIEFGYKLRLTEELEQLCTKE